MLKPAFIPKTEREVGPLPALAAVPAPCLHILGTRAAAVCIVGFLLFHSTLAVNSLC